MTALVTQADREAAAFAIATDAQMHLRDAVLLGHHDRSEAVKAFARHREAATAELVQALEDCLSTLEHTRAFMLEKHGTKNSAREEAMESARQALARLRGEVQP